MANTDVEFNHNTRQKLKASTPTTQYENNISSVTSSSRLIYQKNEALNSCGDNKKGNFEQNPNKCVEIKTQIIKEPKFIMTFYQDHISEKSYQSSPENSF